MNDSERKTILLVQLHFVKEKQTGFHQGIPEFYYNHEKLVNGELWIILYKAP